ncbi:hypothetical protein EVAR_78495_1 [Eumeta japonica]|uniref:Uncharacterized protein n=1 Tax=Eumeta variegata TaxID=151549 RepID=A0A4C1TZJ2_EUMVA|nr:hypothetical protein EVAR_78495_1 [Eumeta japonica]
MHVCDVDGEGCQQRVSAARKVCGSGRLQPPARIANRTLQRVAAACTPGLKYYEKSKSAVGRRLLRVESARSADPARRPSDLGYRRALTNSINII